MVTALTQPSPVRPDEAGPERLAGHWLGPAMTSTRRLAQAVNQVAEERDRHERQRERDNDDQGDGSDVSEFANAVPSRRPYVAVVLHAVRVPS